MGPEEAGAKVKLATTRYEDLAEQLEAAKEHLFDAYADAARKGLGPEELADGSPFTTDYIARRLRERGVGSG
ncbi:hypothetical protein [Actinomadura citrea]|uniref:Uncharacterized protein n=1 Tax=Actinomadura citrea TaxID=46158 RepID=A0A7Y9GEG9_9ACTN|nr:hypothetical protein [Actinomadura citrea]NYE15019.1 hypothetical protein [Actinomadura citrea]GGT84795.1 hypothetical protein GCM10010177_49960 [Actinomadura citrea]